jgi:hypothetical protein
MSADQIAAIRPTLQELADALANGEPRAADLCAEFTVPDAQNVWAQALVGTLNFAYPHTDHPLFRARACGAELPPHLLVQDFVPNRSVTFAHGPCTTRLVARFIDAFLTNVHGLTSDYPIDVTLIYIPAGR